MPRRIRDFVVKKIDEVSVVRFINKSLIAPGEVEKISSSIHGLIEGGACRFVLDFKNVELVSSSTLSMLLDLKKRLAKIQGALVLVSSRRLRELLDISKTRRLFKVTDDAQAAIDQIKAEKP
jgi:anti-anti-sigma factor